MAFAVLALGFGSAIFLAASSLLVYEPSRIAQVSWLTLFPPLLTLALLVALVVYVRQRSIAAWFDQNVAGDAPLAVVSRGRLGGLRQLLHGSNPKVLPATCVRTPTSIFHVANAFFDDVNFHNLKSFTGVKAFDNADKTPELVSVRPWLWTVRVREHRADRIHVFRTEQGNGVVSYVEDEKLTSDVQYSFWEIFPTVDEALEAAERAAGEGSVPRAF